jgi:cation diffusion facilitator CzcD-associated flavoprotein CzcO
MRMRRAAPRLGQEVAVIGAGTAGVCAAKYLMQGGQRVTVYESGSYIGGLWKYDNDNGRSQAYQHLRIITPRRKTRFADFDFSAETSRFPSHAEMQRYLSDYCDHFGITPRIRFRSDVTAVEPLEAAAASGSAVGSGRRWRVTASAPDGSTHSAEYDHVVVATGHLHEPRHSQFLRGFAGTYLHSHAYRNPEPFVGKRVCVVGTGNSGVDVASDVCTVARRTVLVARSGVTIQPKTVFGLPYVDIGLTLRKRWIPLKFRGAVMRTLTYLAHGDQTRLGFRKPEGAQHTTASESLVGHIDFGRVEVKPGIKSISGTSVMFEDGTEEEFDILAAATGYQVHLPFLDPSVFAVRGDSVDLYLQMFPVDQPGLYFVGMLTPLVPYSVACEAQSKTVAQVVDGTVRLPGREAMTADIARVRAWVKSKYTDSPRHALQYPDSNLGHSLLSFRREGAIRALHRGSVPPALARPLAQRAYLRARRVPILDE